MLLQYNASLSVYHLGESRRERMGQTQKLVRGTGLQNTITPSSVRHKQMHIANSIHSFFLIHLYTHTPNLLFSLDCLVLCHIVAGNVALLVGI